MESLYQINYPNYDVIVVDNGSTDDSIEKIKEYCISNIKVESKFFKYNPHNKPIYVLEYSRIEAEKGGNPKKEKYFSKLPSNRKLRLITNEKNYGFAEGNNIGIRYISNVLRPRYILLLNNDTVVDNNFLNELVNVAESEPDIGAVGPKIYYYNYKGRSDIINFAGGRLNILNGKAYHIGLNQIDKNQFDNIRYCNYIEGSCLLIKSSVLYNFPLEQIYFTYWEDIDLCIKILNAGYKLVYVPTAKIWHKVSASSIGSNTKIYYINRNKFLFMKRHANKLQLLIFLIYFFEVQFWFSSLFILSKRRLSGFITFCKGVLDGIFV